MLIGPEENYTVKGRSIQKNLHLVLEIIEGIDNNTDAALISLHLSKAFDRVDHRFLAVILEIRAGVLQMDQYAVSLSSGSGTGKREALGAFCDQAVGPAWLYLILSSLCPHFGAPAPET